MHAATQETQAMSRTLRFGLKNGGETDLDHQSRKESDNEGENGINPYAHHADLVSKNVTAFLGGGFNGHGAFAFDQAAYDFDGGRDTMHLGLSDRCFAGLVIGLRLLAA